MVVRVVADSHNLIQVVAAHNSIHLAAAAVCLIAWFVYAARCLYSLDWGILDDQVNDGGRFGRANVCHAGNGSGMAAQGR